jgi:hypothetical protein
LRFSISLNVLCFLAFSRSASIEALSSIYAKEGNAC